MTSARTSVVPASSVRPAIAVLSVFIVPSPSLRNRSRSRTTTLLLMNANGRLYLRSVDSKVYSPRERTPLVHLGAHEARELLGGIADELGALHQHELAELGILEDFRNLLAEPRDDLLRRPCRREQPVPLVGLVIGEARLPDRRQLGQPRGALGAGDRQRAYPAGLHERQHGRRAVDHELHLAGGEVRRRGGPALIEIG